MVYCNRFLFFEIPSFSGSQIYKIYVFKGFFFFEIYYHLDWFKTRKVQMDILKRIAICTLPAYF